MSLNPFALLLSFSPRISSFVITFVFVVAMLPTRQNGIVACIFQALQCVGDERIIINCKDEARSWLQRMSTCLVDFLAGDVEAGYSEKRLKGIISDSK